MGLHCRTVSRAHLHALCRRLFYKHDFTTLLLLLLPLYIPTTTTDYNNDIIYYGRRVYARSAATAAAAAAEWARRTYRSSSISPSPLCTRAHTHRAPSNQLWNNSAAARHSTGRRWRAHTHTPHHTTTAPDPSFAPYRTALYRRRGVCYYTHTVGHLHRDRVPSFTSYRCVRAALSSSHTHSHTRIHVPCATRAVRVCLLYDRRRRRRVLFRFPRLFFSSRSLFVSDFFSVSFARPHRPPSRVRGDIFSRSCELRDSGVNPRSDVVSFSLIPISSRGPSNPIARRICSLPPCTCRRRPALRLQF